jgi:hypothetical protein
MNIISAIKGLFNRRSQESQPNSSSDEWVAMLAKMLQDTRHEELSCDDVFHIIDQYADLLAQSKDAEKLMPLIKHHLEMCIDCHEEFESLMRILHVTTVH